MNPVQKCASVKCLMCGMVLVSKSRHDFQQCPCLNRTFVDGGSENYMRYGGLDLNQVEVLDDDGKPVSRGSRVPDTGSQGSAP